MNNKHWLNQFFNNWFHTCSTFIHFVMHGHIKILSFNIYLAKSPYLRECPYLFRCVWMILHKISSLWEKNVWKQLFNFDLQIRTLKFISTLIAMKISNCDSHKVVLLSIKRPLKTTTGTLKGVHWRMSLPQESKRWVDIKK